MSAPALPKVRVLLATHNGERFLGEQLDSILNQDGVDLEVLAADDASTDSTPELLEQRAAVDARLTVIRRERNSGGAAPSFFDLLQRSPDDDALIAFADQDDIWLPGKLARHARLLATAGADGVSSNVTAFGDGSRSLVRKDFPQRRLDYLFEGPGPGCTHLLSPRLAAAIRAELAREGSPARDVDFHDWLDYVICRASGWGWHIDAEPTVDYRQHDGNVFGANVGLRSARTRLGLMAERWHRRQATMLADVAIGLTGADQAGATGRLAVRDELVRLRALLVDTGLRARLALAARWPQLRRRRRDQLALAALIVIGRW